MNIVAVIPARMASSRFPGKPLVEILGMPMIGHVALRTAMSKTLSATYIATCDEEIMDYAKTIGIPAIMTADTHTRCTDRTAEAVEKKMGKEKFELATAPTLGRFGTDHPRHVMHDDRQRRRVHRMDAAAARRRPAPAVFLL